MSERSSELGITCVSLFTLLVAALIPNKYFRSLCREIKEFLPDRRHATPPLGSTVISPIAVKGHVPLEGISSFDSRVKAD